MSSFDSFQHKWRGQQALAPFYSSFVHFASSSVKIWRFASCFWKGLHLLHLLPQVYFITLELQLEEDLKVSSCWDTSKCLELFIEFSSSMEWFGVVYSTYSSYELCFGLSLMLGLRKGFNWEFHLKIKLPKRCFCQLIFKRASKNSTCD